MGCAILVFRHLPTPMTMMMMLMIRLLLVLVVTILHLCISSYIVSYTIEQVDRSSGNTNTFRLQNEKKVKTNKAMTPRGTTTTNADAYRANTNQETSKHQIQMSKEPSHHHSHQRMRRRHLHKQHKQKKQHQQKHQQATIPPSPIPPSPPPVFPSLPVPIGSFTLYNSETDQPLSSIFSYYPLLHQSNNWTVYYKIDLSETGRNLNVKVEFNQWVDHVIYFWDGQPVRRRKDRIPPYFIGAYDEDDDNHHHHDDQHPLDSSVVVYDVLRFFPLTVPGNHTMIARAMKTKTDLLQDFTIQFQVITTQDYLERVLINAGKDDEQYLMNPERSYSFGINYDEGDEGDHDDDDQHPPQDPPMALKFTNTAEDDADQDVAAAYGVEYFQTLRKSEYRGGGRSDNDVPIFYTLTGLFPSALHRVTVGFVETEPAYCDPQHDFFQSKSYFIFCNGNFFDHAYNILQYVPCDTVHLATGYFPSSDQGVLTVSFLSKFYPWETTVALVDVELFHWF